MIDWVMPPQTDVTLYIYRLGEVLPRKESFYNLKISMTPQFYSDPGSAGQTSQAHQSNRCGRCRIGYKTPHRSDR
jgi:hypothetical protein